jgi:hypothetical protein
MCLSLPGEVVLGVVEAREIDAAFAGLGVLAD